MSDGQAGILNLVQQQVVTDTVSGTEANLKQSIDAQTHIQTPVGTDELPLYIEVPSLGIRSGVESPETTSVSVLDNALSRGPVYYQGSGTPGNRNMLIFGHSTGFSIVHNQAYKVFNNIKLGKKGDYVYVRTSTGVYTYVIREVKKMSKYSTWIQFNSDKALLTLSTCDSFGKKSDRWVLEAEYLNYKKN
jgi:LPXTG-site transpeptidase (sortase) family protein